MFQGKTRGVKAEMYAINKQQQRREWELLKHVYRIRLLPFTLPDPPARTCPPEARARDCKTRVKLEVIGEAVKSWPDGLS